LKDAPLAGDRALAAEFASVPSQNPVAQEGVTREGVIQA
jgi:hypothetical protein